MLHTEHRPAVIQELRMNFAPFGKNPRASLTSRRRYEKLIAFAVAALLATSFPVYSQNANPDVPSLLLGAAWYPEQWPEPRWEADLQLMEDAHLHVVRVGEFAWSTLEPSQGHYDLDWLARAIRLAEKHHIAVVIGTPTDAPPAWLTSAHPETLRVDADGRRAEHGGRRQFNYANSVYRVFCAAIAAQLARRFGHDPNVIGWQIGNEYTDESFDAGTRRLFDEWLRRKYKTLDALNSAWTTAYWSQTYDRWDEIPLPTAEATRDFYSITSVLFPTRGAVFSASRSTLSANMPSHASSLPPTSAGSAGQTIGTTTRSRATSTSLPGTTTSARGI